MAKFELGGHEVKQDTGGESITALDQNKTMIISKLTNDEPLKPEFQSSLKTMNDVFKHYKPNVDVEFTDADGSPVNNNIKFNSVGDFGKDGLVKSSDFIRDLEAKRAEYLKFIKMLKIKQMGNILKDDEAKGNYIAALQSMIQELEETGA